MKIALSKIRTSTPRVRQSQDPEELDVLAASITALNQSIVPVGVRKAGDGYTLVYGHRRVAAAKQAGLTEIDAIEIETPDDMLRVYGLVENVVRENMTAMDIAKALGQIKEESGWSDEKIGKFLGHDKTWVEHYLKLLVPEIAKAIGKSSAGTTFTPEHLTQVKAGLGKDNEAYVAPIVKKVVAEGLSKRQGRMVSESIAAELKSGDTAGAKALLATPFSATVHDAPAVRKAAATRKATKPSPGRRWEDLPQARKILDFISLVTKSLPNITAAARAGVLSPEAKKFLGRRLSVISKELASLSEWLQKG